MKSIVTGGSPLEVPSLGSVYIWLLYSGKVDPALARQYCETQESDDNNEIIGFTEGAVVVVGGSFF